MRAIKIEVNNVKSRLYCPKDVKDNIIKAFEVKIKDAHYMREHLPSNWDGKKKWVSKAGWFGTGHLENVLSYIAEHHSDLDVTISDTRNCQPQDNYRVVDKFGNVVLRPEQKVAVSNALNKTIAGQIYFPRGIINATTNAGKSLIAVSLAYSFNKPTILLFNSKTDFEDNYKELSELIGYENIGVYNAKKCDIKRFTMVMVQTVATRYPKKPKEINELFRQFEVVLVNEADVSQNRQFATVLDKVLGHVPIRIGLTGTAFMSDDKNNNEGLRAIYGNELYNIRNKEMQDKGYSAKTPIHILLGNTKNLKGFRGDIVYDLGIVESKSRNKRIKKVVFSLAVKRLLPLLIVVRKHEHVKILYNTLNKAYGKRYRVESVKHDSPNRKKITADFKNGKIDILVGTMIFKRGVNFKLMKSFMNAAGSGQIETTLQLLGRAMRQDKSKKETQVTHVIDFKDMGHKNLEKNSRKRIKAYEKDKQNIKDYTGK